MSRRHIGICFLLLFVCLTAAAQSLDLAKIAELKQTIETNEPKKLWTKINWSKDIAAALKRAQDEKKPVMVFLMVNEKGRKDAERC